MTEQTVTDPLFGTLTWSDSLEWWEGAVEIAPGQTIQVAISSEGAPITPLLEKLTPNFARLRDQERELRQKTAESLMELCNSGWSAVGPVDLETFVNTISLRGVTYYADGSAEVFYRDGGLFAGHSIVIALGRAGEFEQANLAG